MVWWCAWQFFVYDSPEQHPRISACERNYLHEALSSSMQLSTQEEEKAMKTRKENIPWKSILTCSALWINTLAQFGGEHIK
jgi:hypothetical protein